MPSHDTAGRPYAKLSTCRAGTRLEADAGFTCMTSGRVYIVRDSGKKSGNDRYFLECSERTHLLSGQADDGEHLIGLYNADLEAI